MTRHNEWSTRLAEYFDQHRDTPFAWGAHDCVTFANGAHAALTGLPLALPSWSCESGADACLEAAGGLCSAVDGVLQQVSPKMAQRGDILLMGLGDRAWLAVCDGDRAFAPDSQGLRSAPMRLAEKAWSVGRG